MGYYAKLYIIENVETFSILTKILEFKQELLRNSEQILIDNFSQRPSIFLELAYESFNDYAKDLTPMSLNRKWLQSLFQITVVYFPKTKILSFINNSNYFDDKVPFIEFQDSTDQDYKREQYSGIELAEKLFDKIINIPDNDYKKMYYKDNKIELLNHDEISYIKRCHIYREVENTFCIQDFLKKDYNFDNEERFKINVDSFSINSSEFIVLQKKLNLMIKSKFDNISN